MSTKLQACRELQRLLSQVAVVGGVGMDLFRVAGALLGRAHHCLGWGRPGSGAGRRECSEQLDVSETPLSEAQVSGQEEMEEWWKGRQSPQASLPMSPSRWSCCLKAAPARLNPQHSAVPAPYCQVSGTSCSAQRSLGPEYPGMRARPDSREGTPANWSQGLTRTRSSRVGLPVFLEFDVWL